MLQATHLRSTALFGEPNIKDQALSQDFLWGWRGASNFTCKFTYSTNINPYGIIIILCYSD